jgi:hypothetical protein
MASLPALAEDRPGRRVFRIEGGVVFPQRQQLAKDVRWEAFAVSAVVS